MNPSSQPLKAKTHWKKRHYKKNSQKIESFLCNVLSDEIGKEIDAQLIQSINNKIGIFANTMPL